MKKNPQELFQLACQALERAGAHAGMARAAAGHLVAAEEHGLPTHGMSRVPFYCSMLRNGRADGNARPCCEGRFRRACSWSTTPTACPTNRARGRSPK
jgi:(2R)-3-sulfolactate dehydrogenase (NADP+)